MKGPREVRLSLEEFILPMNKRLQTTRCRSYSLADPCQSCLSQRDLTLVRTAPAYHSTSGSILRELGRRAVETVREEEVQIDAGESPPADHSLFFDNFERLRDVGYDIERVRIAMEAAVEAGEMDALIDLQRGIIVEGPDGTLFPDADAKFRNIAYLWACFGGRVDLLPRLEASGADMNFTGELTGLNAMLISCMSNSATCVEYLIKRGMDCNAVDARTGYTPLHFAAFGNAAQVATILLDNGAKIRSDGSTTESVLHCAVRARAVETVALLLERGASVGVRNQAGETPLHVACFVQSIQCVELILRRPGVEVNATSNDLRIPLHFAVMSTTAAPELIALLLTRGALVNAVDEEGYTPAHIAALNELAEPVNVLLKAGADLSAKTRSGVTVLGVILRKIPDALETFRQILDASVELRRPAAYRREFELRLDFEPLYPSRDDGEIGLVDTILEEHRKDLLQHPLVTAFLHLKWEKMRKFYLLRIILYLITVVSLTAYVLSAVTGVQCYQPETQTADYCSENSIWVTIWSNVLTTEYYLLTFLACSTAARKLFEFFVYHSVKQYFSYTDNILDIFVVIGLFVATSTYDQAVAGSWQNYVWAFAILCAWTNVMLMIGQLPAFGTYVGMFTQVQWEFGKLLIAYSGVLIGFTVSFCVIFVGDPSFSNPFTGFIKIMAMMAGEVDFQGLILTNNKPADGFSYVSIASQLLFVLFLFFITVVMMNLLVGIAVDDITGLRKNAGITKVIRQTKLIVFVETALRKNVVPKRFREWVLSSGSSSGKERKHVLVVNPFNPLERRLPKDILYAVYELAQRNAPLESDVVLEERVKKSRKEPTTDVARLNSVIAKLSNRLQTHEENINAIKEQLERTNKALEEILSLVKRSDS
ncbi:transient receptor potential channel pyrexia-like isoform X1 [Diprion similis]|uniref:transient receptor potential channel pyrexia-like isoform X1 n=1 Tax=Diprion similis TaxID=362088 RepID=UPI001EF8C046|nr:transient receptor potential channel pyrexia-like isoform X1 [Diprion similis]